MRIWIDFQFESAHRLPHVPEGHKCGRLHGHNYRVRLFASGQLVEPQGWIVDYFDIQAAWKPISSLIDHRYLNEIDGLENPTTEVLARWIWQRVKPSLPSLCRVEIHETDTTGCEYEGEPL